MKVHNFGVWRPPHDKAVAKDLAVRKKRCAPVVGKDASFVDGLLPAKTQGPASAFVHSIAREYGDFGRVVMAELCMWW